MPGEGSGSAGHRDSTYTGLRKLLNMGTDADRRHREGWVNVCFWLLQWFQQNQKGNLRREEKV